MRGAGAGGGYTVHIPHGKGPPKLMFAVDLSGYAALSSVESFSLCI